MPELRRIDPAPFTKLVGTLPQLDPGPAPILQWVDIADLRVDPAYQRDVFDKGRKNIAKIAREFEWSKFAPVIVATIEGGRYAVVDGQHRTIAARLRGIRSVPCQVIQADRSKQAAAFAAINATVTEMNSMQVHVAKLAAGDAEALRLHETCVRAGVTICRYPIHANKMKVGETMAAGMLYRMIGKFGDAILEVALSCITRTRDGNVGMVRSQLVIALCVVLEAEPGWSGSPDLLPVIAKLDLAEAFRRAVAAATPGSGGGIVGALVEIIGDHLERHLATEAA